MYFFQSILVIVIFHSTFLKVEKQIDFFCFKYIPKSRDLTPTPSPAQNCEKRWELPLSIPFLFIALPHRGKSNGVDYFGLWEGLPSPWWGYGKQPKSNTGRDLMWQQLLSHLSRWRRLESRYRFLSWLPMLTYQLTVTMTVIGSWFWSAWLVHFESHCTIFRMNEWNIM